MPAPYQVQLQPGQAISYQIVPGMTYEIPFIQPNQEDWRLWDFRCDVRLKSAAADDEGDPVFALNSDDDEITVAQTAEEIEAAGDKYQLITLRFPSDKTLLLAEAAEYKFDVWAFLISDATTRLPVFPYSEFRTLERVTRVE